ncbi:hypothetical protein DASC09_012400 [Saccharomycopsis crataegensis]|uniref:Serine/threonine-protein kinase BUR1 n=1 Tax=Saccharomycopsis crataegensis TaxID=43959 RepID=A0AAV5QHH1_9ASCO|nr:hypothetical protein DASC09_012400 [Saccharomycopsis crataegensis]
MFMMILLPPSVSGIDSETLRWTMAQQLTSNNIQLPGYDVLDQIGEGTFGLVVKARQRRSPRMLVAIKKLINSDSSQGFHITSIREIVALKALKHKNLLQVLEVVSIMDDKAANNSDPFDTFLVLPYMACDLAGVISNLTITLKVPEIKNFMLQILNGLSYLHNNKFIHRDIKTANILISRNNLLKIADFGLTRKYQGPAPVKNEGHGGGLHPMTNLVVARWYRAPELLLGERCYTTSIDLWAVGCIFGEFYIRKPLLTGSSDLDQLNEIFKLVGSPTKGRMPLFDKLMEEKLLNKYSNGNKNMDILDSKKLKLKLEGNLVTKFGSTNMDPIAMSLFTKLLTLDPNKRFNAYNAMNHDWFKTDPLPCKRENIQPLESRHELDIKKERLARQKQQLLVPPQAANSNSQASPNSIKKSRSDNILDYLGVDELFNKPKFQNPLGNIRSRSNSNNSDTSTSRFRSNSNNSMKGLIPKSKMFSRDQKNDSTKKLLHPPGTKNQENLPQLQDLEARRGQKYLQPSSRSNSGLPKNDLSSDSPCHSYNSLNSNGAAHNIFTNSNRSLDSIALKSQKTTAQPPSSSLSQSFKHIANSAVSPSTATAISPPLKLNLRNGFTNDSNAIDPDLRNPDNITSSQTIRWNGSELNSTTNPLSTGSLISPSMERLSNTHGGYHIGDNDLRPKKLTKAGSEHFVQSSNGSAVESELPSTRSAHKLKFEAFIPKKGMLIQKDSCNSDDGTMINGGTNNNNPANLSSLSSQGLPRDLSSNSVSVVSSLPNFNFHTRNKSQASAKSLNLKLLNPAIVLKTKRSGSTNSMDDAESYYSTSSQVGFMSDAVSNANIIEEPVIHQVGNINKKMSDEADKRVYWKNDYNDANSSFHSQQASVGKYSPNKSSNVLDKSEASKSSNAPIDEDYELSETPKVNGLGILPKKKDGSNLTSTPLSMIHHIDSDLYFRSAKSLFMEPTPENKSCNLESLDGPITAAAAITPSKLRRSDSVGNLASILKLAMSESAPSTMAPSKVINDPIKTDVSKKLNIAITASTHNTFSSTKEISNLSEGCSSELNDTKLPQSSRSSFFFKLKKSSTPNNNNPTVDSHPYKNFTKMISEESTNTISSGEKKSHPYKNFGFG